MSVARPGSRYPTSLYSNVDVVEPLRRMIWQHACIQPPASPINGGASYAGPSTPGQQQLKLVLDHDCKHQGCRDEACRHCRHSSTRCSSTLRPVYVSGQLLLACCCGEPQARLVPALGEAGLLLLPGWQLQVQLLDSKAYEDLNQNGQQLDAQQLASCLVRGSPLLQSGAEQRGSSVRLPLQSGAACLAGLRCIKPEKATDNTRHSGQTTLCRLLLTVTAIDGAVNILPEVLPLVSGPFKVVTARSKGAAKAEVPLPSEAVSRLRGVGKDMAAILKALRVTDAGTQLGPVETVAQFHALQQWVDRGGAPRLQQLLQDTGIKPAAYKEAAKHVKLTAFPEFRPRVWWQQGQPQKRHKQQQQQQQQAPAPELGAADDCRVDVVVRSAQADTVAGPAAAEAVMVGPEDADDVEMMEDIALLLDSLPPCVHFEDEALSLSLEREPSWLTAADESVTGD
ncbi:hypothetical protein OEZ85_007309 [Tetradesmus obliquus]|uniref:Uncharacterized protein n=1 Tax=Tetradesmus obliquus TaxID=3088 RepID=A0ABY8TY05_TETOB|nr:hypothetical protein OEZ85_007309 [Tetradesmus obliquus]